MVDYEFQSPTEVPSSDPLENLNMLDFYGQRPWRQGHQSKLKLWIQIGVLFYKIGPYLPQMFLFMIWKIIFCMFIKIYILSHFAKQNTFRNELKHI